MGKPSEKTLNLAGVQKVARSMSALPVRIDYQSPRYEHLCLAKEDDFLFDHPRYKGQGEIRKFTNLDPYAVREAFAAVADPASALRFLSEAGNFWPFQAVRWSQFLEWQRFFEWLRREPDDAMRFPDGKKAWITTGGYTNEFFAERAIFSPSEPKKIDPKHMREIEVNERHTLQDLQQFAVKPIGDRVSIEWRDPDDDSYALCPRVPEFQGRKLAPFLHIEAHNVIEAIAATIFADRCDGVKNAKCKHCKRLFQVQSNHGQEFCPSGPSTSSSTCKNAYQQQVYRDRDAKAIAFLLDCWGKGLSKEKTKAAAIKQEISITPKAREQAKKRWQRKL
jgi:hypothetical protein